MTFEEWKAERLWDCECAIVTEYGTFAWGTETRQRIQFCSAHASLDASKEKAHD